MGAQPDGIAALQQLLAGNSWWAHGGAEPLSTSTDLRNPLAAVVCCAELGPAPERLFGRPIGSLFILQGASVCIGPSIVAGLGYAIETLGIRLVAILAHTDCGLVEYLLDGASPSPAACASAIARELERTQGLTELIAAHDVRVVPLVYDQGSRRVRLVL